MSLRDIFGNLSEYEKIFKDNDDNDLGFDPAEADENGDPEDEIQAEIDAVRGTISKGDCIFGHAKNAMIYDGSICFVCKKCGMTIDEDGYYRWATSHQVEIDDTFPW